MQPILKRTLHRVGSALAIVGIIFVGLRLYDYSLDVGLIRLDNKTWFFLAALAVVYGMANILLASAWRYLLLHFSCSMSWLCAIRIYGQSQLAKYVPGNVMHIASRQALGLAAGIHGWSLAKASVWELCLISILGGSFTILVAERFLFNVTSFMSVTVFVITIFFLTAGFYRLLGSFVALAVICYFFFLVISGMLFVSVLEVMSPLGKINYSQFIPICSAFIVAWLAGLITPGAPAGVGVREFVLLFLLRGLVIEESLLSAVLFSRVITVFGDVLFYLFSLSLRNDKSLDGIRNRSMKKRHLVQ